MGVSSAIKAGVGSAIDVGAGSVVNAGEGAGVAVAAVHATDAANATTARTTALRRRTVGLGILAIECSWNLFSGFGDG